MGRADFQGSSVTPQVNAPRASAGDARLATDREAYAGRLTLEIASNFLRGHESAFLQIDGPEPSSYRRFGIIARNGEIHVFDLINDHGLGTLQAWTYSAETGRFLMSNSETETASGVVPLPPPERALGNALLLKLSDSTPGSRQSMNSGRASPKDFLAQQVSINQDTPELLSYSNSAQQVVKQSGEYSAASGAAQGFAETGRFSTVGSAVSPLAAAISRSELVNLSYRLNFEALTGARREALGVGNVLSGEIVANEGLMVPHSIPNARESAYDAYLEAWEQAIETGAAAIESAGTLTNAAQPRQGRWRVGSLWPWRGR